MKAYTVVKTPAGSMYTNRVQGIPRDSQNVGMFLNGTMVCLTISRQDAADLINNYRKHGDVVRRNVRER